MFPVKCKIRSCHHSVWNPSMTSHLITIMNQIVNWPTRFLNDLLPTQPCCPLNMPGMLALWTFAFSVPFHDLCLTFSRPSSHVTFSVSPLSLHLKLYHYPLLLPFPLFVHFSFRALVTTCYILSFTYSLFVYLFTIFIHFFQSFCTRMWPPWQ